MGMLLAIQVNLAGAQNPSFDEDTLATTFLDQLRAAPTAKDSVALIKERVEAKFRLNLSVQGLYLEELLKALVPGLAEPKDRASTLKYIGVLYYDRGFYSRAMAFFNQALSIAEKHELKAIRAALYNNMANVFRKQNNLEAAEAYYQKALVHFQESAYEIGMADVYNNLSLLRVRQGEHHQAIDLLYHAELLRKKTKDQEGLATAWNNLGDNYLAMDNYDKALYYQKRALELSRKIQDRRNQVYVLISLAHIFREKDSINLAQEHLYEAMRLARAIHHRDNLTIIYENLGKIYAQGAYFDSAYHYQKLYACLKDSIYNLKNNRLIALLKESAELNQKQTEINRLNQDKEWRDLVTISLGVLLLVVLLATVLVLRAYGQKRRMNADLLQTNEAIQRQNLEMNKQHTLIDRKNAQMESSLRYASQVQQNLLPPKKLLGNFFEDYFVMLKPKEQVSGDIYWYGSKNDWFLLAAVDCRGHGVPGALSSVLVTNLLKGILSEEDHLQSAHILGQLHKQLIQNFSEQAQQGNYRHSVDISLLSYNLQTKKAWISGAMMSALFVPKGSEEGIWLKGNRLSMGSDYNEKVININQLQQTPFEVKEGDSLYFFTDGMPDQFGGGGNRKFGYKRMRDVFNQLHHLPMTAQKKQLGEELQDWQGNHEQTDDILVMGVRF